MSSASESSLKPSTSLSAIVLWASLGAGLLGAIVTVVRSGGLFDASSIFGAFLVELLLGSGVLMVIGAVLSLVATRLWAEQDICKSIGRPFSRLVEIWNGKDDGGAQAGRFFGWIASQLLFFFSVFASSVYIIGSFNELVRACVLIGFVAVLVLSFCRLFETLSSRLFSAFFRKLGSRTRVFVRTAIVLLGVFFLFVVTLGLLFSDELFGGFDPSVPAVVAFFVCAVSLASSLFLPVPKFLKRASRILSLGAVSLLVGAILLGVHDGSLGAVARRGVLAREVYRELYSILDMDGDGFPWILGGDCHPFDSQFGPFAIEIPGNGFDENCDGSDKPVIYAKYIDPLEAADKAPQGLRRTNGNVLFIIVDAARADHLPMYGYDRNTTPAIERFSKTATIFDNTFAVANHTSASMPAILTGLYPSTFPDMAKIKWSSFKLEKKYKPIQTRFKSAGYRTFMYAGHRLAGFIKGFDKINKDRSHRTSADKLTELALGKLEAIGPDPEKPALFFIHYIDPHHSYRAPSKPFRFGMRSIDRYDGELAYVDENLERILSLAMSKEYKDWLIVVTSDHGESFREHGTKYHGFNLYDEEVRVPLVMRVPSSAPGRESMTVSHLDLVPTIMDWTGLEPDVQLPGRSLLPLFLGKKHSSKSRRVVFSEFFRVGTQFAVHDGRYTLIYRQVANRFELYDKVMDPYQKNNLYGHVPANELKNLLMRHVAAVVHRNRDTN